MQFQLPAHPRPLTYFVLFLDFTRQIIQDGGSTIEREDFNNSAQKNRGIIHSVSETSRHRNMEIF